MLSYIVLRRTKRKGVKSEVRQYSHNSSRLQQSKSKTFPSGVCTAHAEELQECKFFTNLRHTAIPFRVSSCMFWLRDLALHQACSWCIYCMSLYVPMCVLCQCQWDSLSEGVKCSLRMGFSNAQALLLQSGGRQKFLLYT